MRLMMPAGYPDGFEEAYRGLMIPTYYHGNRFGSPAGDHDKLEGFSRLPRPCLHNLKRCVPCCRKSKAILLASGDPNTKHATFALNSTTFMICTPQRHEKGAKGSAKWVASGGQRNPWTLRPSLRPHRCGNHIFIQKYKNIMCSVKCYKNVKIVFFF
jgi:hypothetical protein